MVQIAPISESLPAFLKTKNYSKIFVITDTNTHKYCYPSISEVLPAHQVMKIASGEQHKNLGTAEKIWAAMTKAQLDRHALVINLGGGVIGDMGGFCAATYKRGIDFIQMPTTLLAQVDASVGGKLGIDFQGLKNHIGAFQIPNAVLIDSAFLKTLSSNELRSGFAEIVKHCLIADASQWSIISKLDLDEQPLEELIAHSVEIKKEVVRQDPTEKGLRKILNFGHTLGHAIETFYLGKPKLHLLHGEAIAAGMICEAFLSFKHQLISIDELAQIEEFIFSIFGKATIKKEDIPAIIALTLQDKKNQNGQVKFAILEGIGKCRYDVVVNKKEMQAALAYYI
jgi:3-dehydroquinate synthase